MYVFRLPMTSKFLVLVFVIHVAIVQNAPSNCPEETHTIEIDGSNQTVILNETRAGETFTFKCGENYDKEIDLQSPMDYFLNPQ